MKTFNRKNAHGRPKATVPTIYLNPRSGTFRFDSSAVRLLGLAGGDEIEFAFDEDEHQWYMRKSPAGGLPIRPGSSHSGLVGSSAVFVDEVWRTLRPPAEAKTVVLPIAIEPTEIEGIGWHALLTIGAIYRSNQRRIKQAASY